MRNLRKYQSFLPFVIPVTLFAVSFLVAPTAMWDSAVGLIVYQNMADGAAFNHLVYPDPADISRDTAEFMTVWSPGQYLIPGALVSLGLSYGVAISLTIFLATCAGLVGWSYVTKKVDAPPLVEFLFLLGLAGFQFNTAGEVMEGGRSGGALVYLGGEVLMFAAAPWTLLVLLKCVNSRPPLAFGLTLLTAVFMFFAKLSGLIVFAAIVLALSAVDIAVKRRISGSILGMWAAALVAAILLQTVWLSRGWVAVAETNFLFFDEVVLFPFASASFSVFSAFDLVKRAANAGLLSWSAEDAFAFFFTPLAVVISCVIWARLRKTPYRTWAITFFSILLIYALIFVAIYVKGSDVHLEERHFRFPSILFFLLILLSFAEKPSPWRVASAALVFVFVAIGLYNYVIVAYHVSQLDALDGRSGLTTSVSSDAMKYLRDQQSYSSPYSGRPVVVADNWEVCLALSLQFRVICPFDGAIDQGEWSGRASKVYVVVPDYPPDPTENPLWTFGVTRYSLEKDTLNQAEKLMSAFKDYDPSGWQEKRVGNAVIFSQ